MRRPEPLLLPLRLSFAASQPSILPVADLTGRPDTWQKRIRDFLKVRTSYDVLPLSFRLIIFDTALLVKNSLSILVQNGKRVCTSEAR